MDFGALPPEINSGRMYCGPGCGPMLNAAAAWDELAADLDSAAASYQSVIWDLTDAAWLGPSSVAMTTAVTAYIDWMTTTAAQCEQTASDARAAAAAAPPAARGAVGAAELGRSHPADKTRRRGMAEYPLRCHRDGPRSEPGEPAKRNAFGEYGATRHWRWCHAGPARGRQNCEAAPAECRQLGLTPRWLRQQTHDAFDPPRMPSHSPG
jgi:hypothetical protein